MGLGRSKRSKKEPSEVNKEVKMRKRGLVKHKMQKDLKNLPKANKNLNLDLHKSNQSNLRRNLQNLPPSDPSSLACSLDHCQKQELVSRSHLNFLIFL